MAIKHWLCSEVASRFCKRKASNANDQNTILNSMRFPLPIPISSILKGPVGSIFIHYSMITAICLLSRLLLISNRTHCTIQRSLKAHSCTLSWRKRATRDGSLRTRSSCSLSSDWEKSSGPSPHPPSWGRLGYPGWTMSSAVSRGSSVPGRLEVVADCLAVKECLRAFWRLGMDMCWPMVVNPKYTSGHLWKESMWGAQC